MITSKWFTIGVLATPFVAFSSSVIWEIRKIRAHLAASTQFGRIQATLQHRLRTYACFAEASNRLHLIQTIGAQDLRQPILFVDLQNTQTHTAILIADTFDKTIQIKYSPQPADRRQSCRSSPFCDPPPRRCWSFRPHCWCTIGTARNS